MKATWMLVIYDYLNQLNANMLSPTNVLFSTYSQTNGYYESQLTSNVDENNATRNDGKDLSPYQWGLLGSLISISKDNRLISCVLGATLFTSILNTILLSFVVKSIQLNDNGFINGKITWDNGIQSTVFELPTRLRAGKSISLDSIEYESTSEDKPLIMKVLPIESDSSDNYQVFLSSSSFKSDRVHYLKSDDKQLAETSYLALNPSASFKSNLIAGTRFFILNLINENYSSHNHINNRHRFNTISQLLKYDDDSKSITLPLRRDIIYHELSGQQQPSSVIVEGELVSPEITGTFEDILRIQTRDRLILTSLNNIQLVSKSASVKVTTTKDLSLSCPAGTISLNSTKGLYLTNGIKYLDEFSGKKHYSVGQSLSGNGNKQTNEMSSDGEMTDNSNNDGKQQQQHSESTPDQLIAHNLVTIDGILAAVLV